MRCILCSSTRHKLYLTIEGDRFIDDKIEYYRCEGCGLVFIKPQPLEKLKKMYVTQYRTKIGFLQTLKWLFPYSKHHKPQLNYLRPLLKRMGDALDIGSGEGKLLYLFKLRGWKVLGVEPDPLYAEFANKVLKVPTINGFVEDVELNRKFDLITMVAVLEHLSNPLKTLRKVKSLIKRDGRLYLRVPCNEFRIDHLFMFDERTIIKLLSRVGFAVESIDVIKCKIHLIAKKVRTTVPSTKSSADR